MRQGQSAERIQSGIQSDTAGAVASTWISANAGSGKTYALVSRVVKLLLLGVPAERICCITYTRAAAAEMRARVIKDLRELLLADEARCTDKIVEFLGRAPNADERARARNLFGQMLDSPSCGIELTTIHGFCQRLLRAFPIEAGVAPYFTVLDEAETALIIHRACQRLFDSDDDTDVAEAIALFAECAPEQRFQALAKTILANRSRWNELWNKQTPDVVKQRLYALHGLSPDARDEAFASAFCNLPNAPDATIIRAALPSLMAHSAERQRCLAAALARWCEAGSAARTHLIDELQEALLTNDGEIRSWLLKEKTFDDAFKRVVLLLAEAAVRWNEQRGALACATESYAVALIAHTLLGHYTQMKMDRNALDYDDLISQTVELLTTRQMAAWVMTKLDHRIDHLLVDEAQDTSSGQWKIAEALVSELVASAGGVGSSGIARSLLVVGDEKQSIFSFQGAEPALFARKQTLFSELLEHSAAPMQESRLITSYRSAPAILQLVDTVAALADIAPALTASAHVEQHMLSRVGTVGEVVLYPLVEGEEKIPPAPFTIPTDYQIKRSAAQVLAETIATKIKTWLDEGRVLVNEKRALNAGDILILVHRRNPIVPCLIRALARQDIPVAGIDRLILAEHLAVKDILALIRWIVFTGDDLALAQVLRSPLIGLSEADVLALAYDRKDASLWDRLRHSSYTKAKALIAHWLAHGNAEPYEFLTDILETADTRRSFATRFGEEVHEVLDELKEQAVHIPLTPTLANFAAFLTESTHSIKREQEGKISNQVRIMTVHGAKGLEAPVVILADTVRVPSLKHEQIYQVADDSGQVFPLIQLTERAKSATMLARARDSRRDELMGEYHRLLYVALTRARDELHIFGADKKAHEHSWYATLGRALGQMTSEKQPDGAIRFADAATGAISQKESSAPTITVLPEWTGILAPQKKRAMSLAPSKLAASTPAFFARYSPEAAKERGVRMHRLLQFLRRETTRDELRILMHIVAPDWKTSVSAKIEEEIWQLFQREHWLWELDADAEVNIGGEIEIHGALVQVNGQIDRLIRTPAGLVVVDYKTGKHVPTSAAEVPLNYLLQLKTYVALLRRMEPDTPVRSAILWTSAPKFMELTEIVDKIAWQENDRFPNG